MCCSSALGIGGPLSRTRSRTRPRSLPVETRDGLGAALVCFLNSEIYVNYPDQDWQSFTYAQWAAVKALEEVEPRLDGYLFNDRIYPYLVETPRHMLYECAVH